MLVNVHLSNSTLQTFKNLVSFEKKYIQEHTNSQHRKSHFGLPGVSRNPQLRTPELHKHRYFLFCLDISYGQLWLLLMKIGVCYFKSRS